MEKLGSTDPQRIGAYRLLGRLGAGGMGQVYLARSDRGRTVALKLVREELAAQQEFRDRFRQEVGAARRVGSRWTAPVLDADTEADVPWVATGYVAGPSLHTTVSGRSGAASGQAPGTYGPLPERSVRILGAGLAHALKDIHTAGLIHRDLKPSNILLTIDGPRVIDFGIARALDTVTDGGLTRTGALVGSPGFMSPEQVRGEWVSAASDVFCLGSVLTYALTGRLPFGAAANEMHALLFRIAQEDPDLTGVTPGLDDLIRGCLHKDPRARPSTDDLLALLADGDTGTEPWLPGALIAQLGRHAVELLDSEDPEDAVPAGFGPDGGVLLGKSAPPAVPGASSAEPATEVLDAPAGPAVPPQAPAQPAPGPVHALPAPAGPATPPSGPPPVAVPAPPPGYGYPQQPVQPQQAQGFGPPQQPQHGQGYGHPQQPSPVHGYPYGFPQQPGPGSTPPYGPGYPTGTQHPAPAPEPGRRRSGSTIALIVVAVLVAIGAGGSVYALMNDRGDAPAPKPTRSTGPTPTETVEVSPSPDISTSPSPDVDAEGGIPEGYLGSWSGSIDNATGHSTRELVIRQGEVGETVLTLTAEGPLAGGGTYHCVFEAALTEEAAEGESVDIGPSTVTEGEPAASCSPGAPTTLTLLPDGRLSRENTSSGEKLTYTKTG
ncbi:MULTISPECIES: protein kinase domain-containing protein [unclassified Streptomyces]|uniref:protein kinase domain-containing protein n=1 Tax=unclassified Streptomyces TaxID=2593676 RepID=UPI000DAC2DF9|nr:MULTISPECIES: protein kinase [unclassified Streptomyces]PZT72673.1 serine/threonine protein kinase [Streptomyces sp. AC1-42T]PZT81008.1 serine/threonine protein kinase [Streptomyces sp. AC1-42W]